MTWENILKQKDEWVSREDVRLGPDKMSGAFTMNMFANHNWVKQLDRLLTITKYQSETEQQEKVAPAIVKEAVTNSVQFVVDIMNSLLKNTSLGDELLESSEKYSESTRTFATEHQRPEPPSGESGRGMMPKRLEELAGKSSKAFDLMVENLIRKIHNIIDKRHASGKEIKEREDFDVKGDTISDEVGDYIWDKAGGKKTCMRTIEEVIDDIGEDLDMDKNEISTSKRLVTEEILSQPNTKSMMKNIYVILTSKIETGMASRSDERFEVAIQDVLTPAELKTFERLSELVEMDMGQMGSMRAKVGPQIDPDTGILEENQMDPTTGEPYYIPQDVGQLDKPDFDPADEVFEEGKDNELSTSNAPKVTEYVPGKQRREGEPDMQTSAEWDAWRNKNAMDNLNTDSFDIVWSTIKKK